MKKLFLALAAATCVLYGCDTLSKMATVSKTSVTITSVSLLSFPSKKSDGFNWDGPFDKKPDIYFTIGKDGFKRIVRDNVDKTPVTWSLQKTFTSNNLAQEIEILFYDEDKGVNGNDDFMGSLKFTPGLLTTYPTSTTLKGDGLSAEVSLIWK